MIRIRMPEDRLAERRYVVDVLLRSLLGLDVVFEPTHSQRDYELILENGRRLRVADVFFREYPERRSYLTAAAIPGSIHTASFGDHTSEAVPVIYGSGKITRSQSSIRCDADVFGSSFFMLTRWEECVVKERDEHLRFPAKASLAYKHRFLHRPVVNEYAQLLFRMLKALGAAEPRKGAEESRFKVMSTHDVDWIRYPLDPRALAGDLLKRASLRQFGVRLRDMVLDAYNTFDRMMSLERQYSVAGHYYFMAGGTSPTFDRRYELQGHSARRLIRRIRDNGFQVGLHSSYNAYNSLELLSSEAGKLQQTLGEWTRKGGRNHYLRFEVPTTWRIWAQAGMDYDSTCGYPSTPGFRCGTGDRFTVFDCEERRTLPLVEIPLVFMDGSIVSKAYLEDQDYQIDPIDVLRGAKAYGRECAILFHNSVFQNRRRDFWGLFEACLQVGVA